MAPMPESARTIRARSSWMRVALVVVALMATALAIGLNRHHSDSAGSHESSVVSISINDGAAPAEAAVIDAISGAGGAVAVCALIVLCCIALGARGFALVRTWTAALAMRPRPSDEGPVLLLRRLTPSLTTLSISRT